jgi:7,8-dihydropterin-6-yl-methyl-4-(beta-D-ribofuranosyl)aminobenzene 5'-phosphate synthase
MKMLNPRSVFFLFTLGLVFFVQELAALNSNERNNDMPGKKEENIEITIIYDNNEFQKNLKTGWGFSCLVRTDAATILFDTGGETSLLMENMQKLNINPQEIELIFLSHLHGDHTGGIYGFLEANPAVTVYLPKSFPNDFKVQLANYGAKTAEVTGSVKIAEKVYSTGEMGSDIVEQSLIIQTSKGLIVITGCAHPGIVKIIQRAKELFAEPVLFVMGGFHLGGESTERLASIIASFKSLGVLYAAPCHCSGDPARREFSREYGDKYLNLGVGRIIHYSDF